MGLDSINAAVSGAFRAYGEEGSYIDGTGASSPCSVIQFDPFRQLDVTGVGVENNAESVFVMLEEIPQPRRDCHIVIGELSREIIAVEMHRNRGYARLTLTALE